MSIHLGVSLSEGNATWAELLEGARLVESLGFDSVWAPDHFLTGDGKGQYLESWQVLAAWAALTTRVRLGPLVTPIDFRHPAVLAKMAATLDHVSNGRVILGLGSGWHEPEYSQFGLRFGPPAERVARLAETAAICRSLFDRQRTTFEGRYYRLNDALCEPKPLQQRLPILFGVGGDRAIRLAGRYADWWNGFGTPELIAQKLALVRAGAARAGRNAEAITPSVTIRPLIVRDSRAEIEAQLRVVSERHRLSRADTDYMLAGSAPEVAARLREYLALGVRTFIVQQRVPWDAVSLERLSREVRPLVG